MITAKNYAAQALRYLEYRAIPILKSRGSTGDANNADIMATLIRGATHFVIPDYASLLGTRDFKALSDSPFRLPYPTVTIEFAAPTHAFSKHLIIATETSIANPFIQKVLDGFATESKIAIMVMSMIFAKDHWNIAPTGCIMLDMLDISDDGKTISFFPYRTLPQTLDSHPETDQEEYLIISRAHVTPLCEFIAALSCTNVGTETHQEAYRDNEKRVRQGKLPIYETKTLTLNVTSEKKGGKGGGNGSSTPKRQHFRRGCIRHLASGNYWVNACIVGKNRDGFIDKDYVVK